MKSGRSPKVKALLAVTFFILITDALFIWINYRASWRLFEQDLDAWRHNLKATFDVTMASTASNMQQIATYIANEEHVPQLFWEGRKAVEAEGGGGGGENAAIIRKELLDHVYAGWSRMTETYSVRQLHFHLGPGDVSFLRVHQPDKFGDDLSPVRHTIVDANRILVPIQGFETGRVYSGIRGVTPVFAKDEQTGEVAHVGALEAGTSLSMMLEHLRAATGYHIAALLNRDHLQKIVWPEFLDHRLRSDSVGDTLVMEQTTTPEFTFLRNPDIITSFYAGRPYLSRDFTIPRVVLSFPFKDYQQSHLPDGSPVGFIVAWRDVGEEVAAIEQGLKNNIWFGIVVFFSVETILLLAWGYGMRSLETTVQERTSQLQDLNKQLGREIVERKEAEEQIRFNARRHRSVFMDNKAVMLIVDPNNAAIVDCNDAACDFYRYERSILLRLNVWDLDIRGREFVQSRVRKVMKSSGVRINTRHRLATGEIRDVIVYASPIEQLDSDNIFTIVHDVTDLKIEERGRKEAERRYQEIFENAPVGICCFAKSGQLLRLNARSGAIYGFQSREDFLKHISSNVSCLFYRPEDFTQFLLALDRDGFVNDMECRGIRKDETIIWTSWTARQSSDEAGNNRVDCFIYDISERKKLESLKGDVERMTRHDLMGPLTFILNFPTMIALNGPVTEQQQKDLDNLEHAALRMSNMINMSLNLYRMETGSYALLPSRLDLGLILKRVVSEMQGFSLASEVGLQAFDVYGDDLPTGKIFIMGEELICFTMFQNLVKNAIEASPQGSSVKLTLAVKDSSAIVTIHNMGHVSPEILDVFFEKYVTQGKVGGTGLGTYLAKLVVKIHNGDIGVTSSFEDGTTVTVRLPRLLS